MSNTVKIEIGVRTDKLGSKVTEIIQYDKEDWEEMDCAERNQSLFDDMIALEMIEWDWREIDD